MTPPPRRQTATTVSASASTTVTLGSQVKSIRTLSRTKPTPSASFNAPRTRSMARSTTAKIQVYDENVNPPGTGTGTGTTTTATAAAAAGGVKSLSSGSGRSLRSRGPLKENISMNVRPLLGEAKMDSNGKRKAVDSYDGGDVGKKAAKVMKLVDQPATSVTTASTKSKDSGRGSMRTLSNRPSRDSLRSLKPSAPSTPIHANLSFHNQQQQERQQQQQPIPTPARELLRKDANHPTSPTDSPPAKFVARPPTPPRMRERPQQHVVMPGSSSKSVTSIPFMTLKKAASSTPSELTRTDGRLSKMPVSLRKTPPSQPLPPAITPRQLIVPSMPESLRTPFHRGTVAPPMRETLRTPSYGKTVVPSMPECLRTPLRNTVALPVVSTTPQGAPLTRNIVDSEIPGRSIASTTPTTSPPSTSTHTTLHQPGQGSKTPSKRSQRTLDSFFARPTSASHLDTKNLVVSHDHGSIEEPTSARNNATRDREQAEEEMKTPVLTAEQLAVDLTTTKEEDSAVDLMNVPSDAVDRSQVFEQRAIASTSTSVAASWAPAIGSDPLPKVISSTATISMAPLSRIPRSAAATASSSAKVVEKASSTSTKKPSLSSIGSLPERRPSTRPALVAGSSNAIRGQAPLVAPPSPVKRKPSYPSSLGSGPLARPTPRMVSNPILPPRSLSGSSSVSSSSNLTADLESAPITTQPRSVSAPGPGGPAGSQLRTSLSSSTREGLSGETSKSLAGLSEALGKLKMKRPINGSLSAPSRSHSKTATPSINVNGFQVFEERPSNLTSSTSSSHNDNAGPSRLSSANHRPRASVAVPITVHPGDLSTSSDEGGAADQSIAAMLCSTTGGGCLKGVRAFVDVRTSDGEDSGKVFVEILKGLGARVQSRPTERCTHVIYKSGKSSTLAWWRKQEDPKPLIVGIKWVTECKKAGKKVEEDQFVVDVSKEDVFQKQRKSMEPKAIAAIQSLAPPPTQMRHALLDLAQARQKSMRYAPKISSPLKRGFLRPFDEE
ncbi:hypothetical protein IAT40_001161 [Kwoniella sp. CBS 6097]